MEMESDYNARKPRLTEITENQLRQETSEDITLNILYKVIVNGWSADRADIPSPCALTGIIGTNCQLKNGIIYKSAQVLVPQSMQKEMLRKIHANHFGAESNIRMAREVLFWSGMRKSIQDMSDACNTCDQYGHSAPKEPNKSLPISTGPWIKISVSWKSKDT